MTQQILTTDKFHWLEVITVFLNFLKLLSLRKTITQFFYFSLSQQENRKKNYISGIFWSFKSKFQIINVATYISFLLILITVSFKCCIIFQYLSLLFSIFFCFYFTFFFFLFSPQDIIYNLATIYNLASVWFQYKKPYGKYSLKCKHSFKMRKEMIRKVL